MSHDVTLMIVPTSDNQLRMIRGILDYANDNADFRITKHSATPYVPWSMVDRMSSNRPPRWRPTRFNERPADAEAGLFGCQLTPTNPIPTRFKRTVTSMNVLRMIVAASLLAGVLKRANADEPQPDVLYHTSFEDGEVAAFRELRDGPVGIRASGTAAVSTQFARRGKQCLHLLGDEDNAITFSLPGEMRDVRGISFHAERWTRRAPFTFAVDVRQDGEWQELARLDDVILVGPRFRSHIQLPIPGDAETEAVRFRVAALPTTGVLIDDLSLLASVPKYPTKLPTGVMPSEPLELMSSQSLFVSGTNDTHTFRIPALVTTTNGDLVAACDARRKSSADIIHQRTIDIVVRRSTDNGQTWTPMEMVNPAGDRGCSDPSLIVDEVTGDLFCFYNTMSPDKSDKEFRFAVQRSSDHGKTWGTPVDFTDQVADPELKDAFKFVTSGRGTQTRDGVLIHNYVRVGRGITLFGSRDHGETWEAMGDLAPGDESKVVELPDGSLMVNSRIAPGRRFVHRSEDGGKSWQSEADYSLPDPRCNACIIQYTAKRDGYDKDRLIFCNAASNSGRKNLAARISYDNGRSWSEGKVIDSGPSAYSSITILQDGSIGVLYEPSYAEVRFVRFGLEALAGDELRKPFAPYPKTGE